MPRDVPTTELMSEGNTELEIMEIVLSSKKSCKTNCRFSVVNSALSAFLTITNGITHLFQLKPE